MKGKVKLGENKYWMNYMVNVTDRYDYRKVFGCLTISYDENKNKQKQQMEIIPFTNKDCVKIRSESDIDILFLNKKSVEDMIENLKYIRDNTDWNWRENYE